MKLPRRCACALTAACLVARLAAAGPVRRDATPSGDAKPRPATTLLYQNHLNYTNDNYTWSFLLLNDPLTRFDAQAACQAYSESLLSVEAAKGNATSLTPLIAYHTWAGDLTPQAKLHLADGTIHLDEKGNAVVDASGDETSPSQALCTQSDRQSVSTASNATDANTVTVKSAATGNVFQGYRNLKTFRFLGIPYTNTPARWEYAQLNPARGATFNATKYGPPCVQTQTPTASEDCLFLNVYTPHLPSAGELTASRRLRPVVVFFHGGAYISGEGSDPIIEGSNIPSRGDVVLVTLNYRLSNLGWMVIPGTDVRGNYGFADQATALDWVVENIEAFGGDPTAITIWGQSAGATTVQGLLASSASRGKFHAAILSSNLGGIDYGTTYSKWYDPEEAYDATVEATIQSVGCAGAGADAGSDSDPDPDKIVACLKALPATSLVDKDFVPLDQSTEARFLIVDGEYITASALDLTNASNTATAPATASVPVLWGSTRDDGAPFLQYADSGTSRTQAIRAVLNGSAAAYTAALVSEEDLFPLPRTAGKNASLNAFNLSAQVYTDAVFRCVDQKDVFTGLASGVFPSAYYYQFDRTYQIYFNIPHDVCKAPPSEKYPHGDPSKPYLRCHGGDLAYWFASFAEFQVPPGSAGDGDSDGDSGLAAPLRDADDVLMTRLAVDYLTAFVRRGGNPNPEEGYLEARGYTSTIAARQKGGEWAGLAPGDAKGKDGVRIMDYPPRKSDFLRAQQCKYLGLGWEGA